MMFSGRSMGGGDGGRLLRTFGRAVTRVGVSGNGIQELSSSSSSTAATSPHKPKSATCLSLSSPANCNSQNPVSGLPFRSPSHDSNDFDWVTVDGFEDEGFNGFSESYVLANSPSPSQHEVDNALFSLQEVFCSTSHFQLNNDNCGLRNDAADNVTIPDLNVSVMDWKEPSMSSYDTRMRLSSGTEKVYYAFHLLETEPTVQKMVKSISSDRAVWEAILNNEVVRELRDSASSGEKSVSQSSDGTSTGTESQSTSTNVVMWIFDSSRAKFMEIIEMITRIVADLFQPTNHSRDGRADILDPFTEKLRTSFMLSIIVLLVVVVSRARSS